MFRSPFLVVSFSYPFQWQFTNWLLCFHKCCCCSCCDSMPLTFIMRFCVCMYLFYWFICVYDWLIDWLMFFLHIFACSPLNYCRMIEKYRYFLLNLWPTSHWQYTWQYICTILWSSLDISYNRKIKTKIPVHHHQCRVVLHFVRAYVICFFRYV